MNKLFTVLLLAFAASGCTNTMAVLDGSTHACGKLHAEGYFSDTQGEIVVVKAPGDWTPAMVKEFCSGV